MPASQLSLLDNVRQSNGSEGLKNYYRDLLQTDRDKAIKMINDNKLQFGTLFLLRHELTKAAATEALNPLYRRALELVTKLTGNKDKQTEKIMRSANEDIASILRWMIQTGCKETNPGNEYEQLMEHCAALLAISFRDTAAMPEIAEMIYTRYSSGKLIHELVWAFFEARSPESLVLIAQHLNSRDSREVELSKRLLCFIPTLSERSSITGSALYYRALKWLQENKPFLYYTGESLHLSNLPMSYAVSQAAKYLCRPVSVNNGEPLLPLNEYENEVLSHFRKLPDEQQQLLADFSYMLYKRNIYQWNTWVRLPFDRQKSLASQMMGGLS